MIDGYLKVAAITPNVRVADVEFNCNEICKCIDEAAFLTDRKSDRWPFRLEEILGCHLMPV